MRKGLVFSCVGEYWGQKAKLVMECYLSKMGNQPPYFSITGTALSLTGKRGRPATLGMGAIADSMPKRLQDLAEMHLRTDKGEPMYPVENGCYFLEHLDKYRQAALNHFRVKENELELLSVIYRNGGKPAIANYIKQNLEGRWQAAAYKVINKYHLQVIKEY